MSVSSREGVIKAGDPVGVEKFTGETVSILQVYRDHYTKEYTEESLRRYLNSPIAVREREVLEKALQKLSGIKQPERPLDVHIIGTIFSGREACQKINYGHVGHWRTRSVKWSGWG
jgi:hypothetical protein